MSKRLSNVSKMDSFDYNLASLIGFIRRFIDLLLHREICNIIFVRKLNRNLKRNNMKCNSRKSHCNPLFNTIAFALFLILVGAAFLGFNLGYIPMSFKGVIFSWPMLLVVIGLVHFCKRHFWSGILFLLVGGFFMVPSLIEVCPSLFPVGSGEFVHLYWPILLIAAGVLFVLHHLCPCSHPYGKCFSRHFHSCGSTSKRYNDSVDSETSESTNTDEPVFDKNAKRSSGYFKKDSIFSSGEHIVLDPLFIGGEVNTVLGETILDLRKTDIKEGDTYLKTSTVLGSLVIFVPVEWSVDIRTESVLFSFEDKRYHAGTTDVTKRLLIISSGVLGSGELRN